MGIARVLALVKWVPVPLGVRGTKHLQTTYRVVALRYRDKRQEI